MRLEKIITLANHKVRLRFLAMERSLRAVGCRLPIWVIPFDDSRFELPKGASWWEMPELTGWLVAEGGHRVMRKYQCLTTDNYHFVDADVCFLRNPEAVVEPFSGFITSCGHWNNPDHTVTEESRRILAGESTTWQRKVFNTGQFAADRIMYDLDTLKTTATRPDFIGTCVRFRFHEQPGLNLLVNHTRISVINLTLPPVDMESTWAGDYPGEYEHYWRDRARKPYLIHWAGTAMDVPRPINGIFYQFLTRAEREEWDDQVRAWTAERRTQRYSTRAIARTVRRAAQALTGTFSIARS